MGQQLNKIQKRRRRSDYLERQKIKAKESSVASKVKPRRPAAKKEKAVPLAAAAAPVEAAPAAE